MEVDEGLPCDLVGLEDVVGDHLHEHVAVELVLALEEADEEEHEDDKHDCCEHEEVRKGERGLLLHEPVEEAVELTAPSSDRVEDVGRKHRYARRELAQLRRVHVLRSAHVRPCPL